MAGVQQRQMVNRIHRGIVHLGGSWMQRALEACPLKASHIGPCGLLPCGAAGVKIGALAHSMALRIVLQQCENRFSNRIGILKWNNYAPLLRKQLLGVPIWRRNNRLSGSKRNRKRAGDDLRLMSIRCDEIG